MQNPEQQTTILYWSQIPERMLTSLRSSRSIRSGIVDCENTKAWTYIATSNCFYCCMHDRFMMTQGILPLTLPKVIKQVFVHSTSCTSSIHLQHNSRAILVSRLSANLTSWNHNPPKGPYNSKVTFQLLWAHLDGRVSVGVACGDRRKYANQPAIQIGNLLKGLHIWRKPKG